VLRLRSYREREETVDNERIHYLIKKELKDVFAKKKGRGEVKWIEEGMFRSAGGEKSARKPHVCGHKKSGGRFQGTGAQNLSGKDRARRRVYQRRQKKQGIRGAELRGWGVLGGGGLSGAEGGPRGPSPPRAWKNRSK